MAKWDNFPDTTYVLSQDRPGRPLMVSAMADDGAENPRTWADHDDHMAIFGKFSWIGDDGCGDDPEEYLAELLEDHVEDSAVIASVTSGSIPGWTSLESPFGEYPLVVSNDGSGWNFRGYPGEVAGRVREAISWGRHTPDIDPGDTDANIIRQLEDGPVDGLWVCPSPIPGDTGRYLLVDERDYDCMDSVAATEDEGFLAEVCRRAIVSGRSSGPAMELLESSGISIRPLFLTDHSGLSLGTSIVDSWDSSQVGWQWVDADAMGGEKAAVGYMDDSLAEVDSWLSGDVWTCEVEDVFSGELVDVVGGIYGGLDTGRECLEILGLSDAMEVAEPDLGEPVVSALGAAELSVPGDADHRAQTVARLAEKTIRESPTLWGNFALGCVGRDGRIREALEEALLGEVEKAMGAAFGVAGSR